METHLVPSAENNSSQGGCINCGSLAVMHGYPNPLCETCREALIKFPFPLWIKLFAAGIGLLLAFSIYKIPGNIGIGVHLEKGKTAIEEKKYLTAQRELQKVVDKVPGNIEAEGNLLIASVYNEDFAKMNDMYLAIKNKNIEDEVLFHKIENALAISSSYFPDDSLNALLQNRDSSIDNVPDADLKRFIEKNPGNIYVMSVLAARMMGNEQLADADSMLAKVLAVDADYMPALGMMGSLKRQEKQFEESIMYCDHALNINKESIYVTASKSRTLLRQKKDDEAMRLALAAIKLDEKNVYAQGTLLLAYHFTNNSKEENAMMTKLSATKDTNAIVVLKYIQDVFSGKESFRN